MILTEPTVPVEFEVFRRRAQQITGFDLTSYKAAQMHRRLSSLLARLQIGSFADYASVLERDADRRQEFRDYVTINVSEFFRDPDRFADLERRVLPDLLQGGASLRIWSAGCSIGAEAYSMAILLHELGRGRAHAILATDVDQTIIDRARQGTGFLAADIRNVGADRIRRWFVPEAGGRHSIRPGLRPMIRFATQDLLSNVYPSGQFDLIVCRNVVIYFTEAAKERIFRGFVSALRTDGVLFIGATEAIMRPHLYGLSMMGPGFYRRQVERDG